jgi:hypothetical protein
MANICDYEMDIVGPGKDIVAIVQFMMPAMDHVGKGWVTDVLDFSKVQGDLAGLSGWRTVLHNWHWSSNWCCDFSALIEVARKLNIEEAVKARWRSKSQELGALRITAADWQSPVGLAELLSLRFSALGFRVTCTDDDDVSEEWICFDGQSHLITHRVDYFRVGRTEWFVRGGVKVDPAVVEVTSHVESFEAEPERVE